MIAADADRSRLEYLADEAGVADLFVLRRIAGSRFAHIGGVGRGEGWAGIVEVELDESTVIREALLSGREAWLSALEPANVFGPYYARSAVAFPLPPDTVVVMGSPEQDLGAVRAEALHAVADQAVAAIEHVSPAKRLADELEVLHAVQAISDVPVDTLDATMRQVAFLAAEALSCEVAVLFLTEDDQIAVANRGWPLPADEATIHAAMRVLAADADDCPMCVQDTSVR